MAVEFNCPSCNQSLEGEDDVIGCNIVCPACGIEFTLSPETQTINMETMPLQTLSMSEKGKKSKKEPRSNKKVNTKKQVHMNKIIEAKNRAMRRVKIVFILIVIGVFASWVYGAYKDIYWSTKILEQIRTTLKDDKTRVAYQSIDELKILNASLAQIPNNAKFVKMLNQYLYLFILSRDELTSIKVLVADIPKGDCDVFIGNVVRICNRCSDGIVLCKYCNGTKRCHICNGRGEVHSVSVSGERNYSPCNPRCRYCEVVKLCAACHGEVYIPNRKVAQKMLPEYKEELINLVEGGLREYKSASYAGTRILDKFFAIFDKKKTPKK